MNQRPIAQQCREILFSGRVQGVGFRAMTHQVAQRFAVTGYVQNMDDGRVRLVAEGEPEELDAFVRAVEEELGRYIRHRETSTRPASGQFSQFDIRH